MAKNNKALEKVVFRTFGGHMWTKEGVPQGGVRIRQYCPICHSVYHKEKASANIFLFYFAGGALEPGRGRNFRSMEDFPPCKTV